VGAWRSCSCSLRVERDPVLGGPAGLLAELGERSGRAHDGALQAPLAILVVDPAEPNRVSLRLEDEAEIRADDVAEPAVDAAVEVERGEEALARDAEIADDTACRREDRASDRRLEIAERRRRTIGRSDRDDALCGK